MWSPRKLASLTVTNELENKVNNEGKSSADGITFGVAKPGEGCGHISEVKARWLRERTSARLTPSIDQTEGTELPLAL